jgi:drug/metabolite transporter (DMT)-like permease
MMQWGLILLIVFSSSSGDILCARGMSQGGELSSFGPSGMVRAIRYIVTRRLVILGGLCYAAAFFSLLTLLSVAPLSLAVPATALGFVVDTIGARFLLRERVRWKRWAGVLCVTAGVILTVKSGAVAKLPGGKPEHSAPRAATASSVSGIPFDQRPASHMMAMRPWPGSAPRARRRGRPE